MHMLYVCVLILEAYVRIHGPRNPDLGFLLFRLFWLVLITCLYPVESSFHVSRSRVSRITRFTCLIDILIIRVYILDEQYEHEHEHALMHKCSDEHDMVDEHDEYAWLMSWYYAWMFGICLMLMPY